MKRLKIAIVGWSSSVHIQRWAKGLSERGYKIKVISLGGEPIEGVETAIIPRAGRFSYFTGKPQAVREIRKFSPDIVHAHYATGYAWWGIKAGIRPLIVSVWGSDVMKFPSSMITRAISRRILTKADHICATSELLKQVVGEICPSATQKVTITPFGVQIAQAPPDYPVDETFRICYTKMLLPVYGPDVLLRAFARAIQSVPEMELSIAGQGAMEAELKQLAKDMGIAKRVSFMGQIPYSEIYPFIEKHHLMAMPSRMESFGVAALDAGACARPVIASDIGGVPGIVINNETGFLIPVGDIDRLAEGIIKLAQNRSLGQKIGLNAYHHVAGNFSWESSLDGMSDLYQSFV